jgi:TRAP-type C4-dicarboxylate transport system permease small subunit
MLVSLRSFALAGTRAMTVLACVVLALTTLHVFADVIATKFFHAPIRGTHVIVTHYYMVALFFLPLAFAELREQHISADLLYSVMPEKLKPILNGANLAFLTAFLAVLTWQAYIKAFSQTLRGEQQTAAGMVLLTWPSRWLAVLGFGAMTLAALLRFSALLLSRPGSDLLKGHTVDE